MQANFNSIKVQLEHHYLARCSMMLLFQFHKGTIRTMLSQSQNLRVINFNSIKVQLEPFIICLLVIFLYFNSIKVQLEHLIRFKQAAAATFQFHKGTIRTYLTE